jgi:hypothetical protein
MLITLKDELRRLAGISEQEIIDHAVSEVAAYLVVNGLPVESLPVSVAWQLLTHAKFQLAERGMQIAREINEAMGAAA